MFLVSQSSRVQGRMADGMALLSSQLNAALQREEWLRGTIDSLMKSVTTRPGVPELPHRDEVPVDLDACMALMRDFLFNRIEDPLESLSSLAAVRTCLKLLKTQLVFELEQKKALKEARTAPAPAQDTDSAGGGAAPKKATQERAKLVLEELTRAREKNLELQNQVDALKDELADAVKKAEDSDEKTKQAEMAQAKLEKSLSLEASTAHLLRSELTQAKMETENLRSKLEEMDSQCRDATVRVLRALESLRVQRDDAIERQAVLEAQLGARGAKAPCVASAVQGDASQATQGTQPDPGQAPANSAALSPRELEEAEQARLLALNPDAPNLVALWPTGTAEARRIRRALGEGVFLASQPVGGVLQHTYSQRAATSPIACWWTDDPATVYQTRNSAVRRVCEVSSVNDTLGARDTYGVIRSLAAIKDAKLRSGSSDDGWFAQSFAGSIGDPVLTDEADSDVPIVETDEGSDDDNDEAEVTVADGVVFVSGPLPRKRTAPDSGALPAPTPLKKNPTADK